MHSRIIEGLFARVRRLQVATLFLRLVMLASAAWLTQELVHSAADKYDVHLALPARLAPAILFLIPAVSAVVFLMSQTQKKAAADLDRQYRLKERLITYVEFRGKDHPFVEALCGEIETKISDVAVPLSRILSGLRGLTVMIILLLSGILAIPYLPVPPAVAAKKEEQKQIKQAARKLSDTLQKIQQQKPQNAQIAQLTKELHKMAENLEKSETSKAETLKKLNAMQQRVQDQMERQVQGRKNGLNEAFSNATRDSKFDSKEMEDLLAALEPANGEQESVEAGKLEALAQEGHWSGDQAKRLKQALEDYKGQKSQSERELAELQKSLKDAQKELTGGAGKYTADSKLSEKDLARSKSGVDDGPGTTNFDVGPQSFDSKKKDGGQYMEDRTKSQYEQLYNGQREKAGSEPLYLSSKWNSEDSRYTKIRSFGSQSDSKVGSAGSGLAQQNQNESEVRKERIPAAYRKMVKKYLESIQ